MAAKKSSNGMTLSRGKRKTRRSTKVEDDGVANVYKDMLAEAAISHPPAAAREYRPAKRRKMSLEPSIVEFQDGFFDQTMAEHSENTHISEIESRPQQTVYDDFDESDESDQDFEDVDLNAELKLSDEDVPVEQKPLELNLAEIPQIASKRTPQRRKPITSAERELRLNVHKWHLLCLLLHMKTCNQWCESHEVQGLLKPLVSRKTISMLHINEGKPQFQRTHSFNEAMREICAIWKLEWKITAKGMSKAYWREDVDAQKESDLAEDPIDFNDFKEAATTRSGSRDLGAQLFCALLRSVAVETRLVCSLPVLPFSGVSKGQTPEKPKPKYIYASSLTSGNSTLFQNTATDPSNLMWRNSEHSGSPLPHHNPNAPRKRTKESPFPIWWVEVFLPATQSWIPVDPVVRHTINKPKTGFEPPLSDTLNSMSYVVAFEEDGYAKDVTRRYSQHYNAKTRKTRVESTKGGEAWWTKALQYFERFKLIREDRDEIEDADLRRREAAEPMPRNIQDFKGHPWYVLERHLRRNEVIHPVREAGKVSVGVAKNAKLESVYRRQDVHIVRSSDQWYRRGRDVRVGEQPLKRVLGKRSADDLDEDRDEEELRLYAEFQTDVYVPPNVVKGRIPKNAYGNLDVYVQSMIPAGAIHLQHPDAAKAARLVGVDYADAVTGFDFKGRQGTAVINGIVVAAEFRDALTEVVHVLEHERVTAEEARRSAISLHLWKRFMTALRIRAQVNADYGGFEAPRLEDSEEDEQYQDSSDEGAGGFMPEPGQRAHDSSQSETSLLDTMALPPLTSRIHHEIVIVESPHELPVSAPSANRALSQAVDNRLPHEVKDQLDGGGFLLDEESEQKDGASFPMRHSPSENESDFGGGGFLENDDDEMLDGGEDVTETHARISEQLPLQPEAPHHELLEMALQESKIDDLRARTSSQEHQRVDTEVVVSTQDSFADEKGSLLSEDPEDEDAEPYWLADGES